MNGTRAILVGVVVGIAALASAREPTMVLLWPDANQPTLKLTFGKFQGLATYQGQNSFVSDVQIENLSPKAISHASFTVYLLDKKQVRIGSGVLQMNDLGVGQQQKLAFQVFSVGIPASLSLVARNDRTGVPTSLMTISLMVVSVPSGAMLKVDGKDAGITPKAVSLTVGTHNLEFSKEGYATGSTPVEITPDELPGGSITIDLGGLSRDTVELRDGTVVLGDLISMTLTSVVVRVDGNDKTYDRNQVKKVMLVERVTTIEQPVTVQPAPPKPN